MGQTERKELLSQFIGLNVFDKLAASANDKIKELTGAIKTFNKENSQSKIDGMKTEIDLLESKLIDLSEQKEKYSDEYARLNEKINAEQAKLVKLDNVPTNVAILKKEKESLESKIKQAIETLSNIDKEIETKKKEYDEIVVKMSQFPSDLKEKADKYSSLSRNKQRMEQDMEKLKLVVREKLNKLDHLSKHEYDPNCKYCCNNAFVKDAMASKTSLNDDKEEAKTLSASLTEIKSQIEELEPSVSQYQSSSSLKDRLNVLSSFISKKELEKATLNNMLDKSNNRATEIDNQIEIYERSKEVIENNKTILGVIAELKLSSNELSSKLKNIEKSHVDAYSRKVSVSDQIKNIEEQVKKIEDYENEVASYQYYITAIGKDGVPYRIISDAIPKIEQEVNNILSHIVEFTMEMETDGKNVNVYIKYDDRKWPLELCSGMEKFVAGLALRVALINISNLPRPNFLVIDEGASALDASNFPMLHSLFDYMKRNFDFIIIISHLDAMRDMVNKQLEIKKENGFSKIDNSV
jgi:DNA repair exonuclease SbcCD ATPase subunit